MLFVQVSLKAEIGMKSSMDLTLFEKRKEMTEVKKELEGKERGKICSNINLKINRSKQKYQRE